MRFILKPHSKPLKPSLLQAAATPQNMDTAQNIRGSDFKGLRDSVCSSVKWKQDQIQLWQPNKVIHHLENATSSGFVWPRSILEWQCASGSRSPCSPTFPSGLQSTPFLQPGWISPCTPARHMEAGYVQELGEQRACGHLWGQKVIKAWGVI